MKRLSFFSLVFFITFFAATIFLFVSESLAGDLGDKIEISGTITKDPLGIEFKVSEYGSAIIEIANNSNENLTIGDDMFIWVDASKSFNVALLMPSYNSIPEDQLSDFVYACGVNNFSKIKKDGVLWAFARR